MVRQAFTMAMRCGAYVAAEALIWPYFPVATPRPVFRLSSDEIGPMECESGRGPVQL
jgi:hypothetical protein